MEQIYFSNTTTLIMFHIIQRSHNRQVVSVSDEDYFYYIENLMEWKENLGGKINLSPFLLFCALSVCHECSRILMHDTCLLIFSR